MNSIKSTKVYICVNNQLKLNGDKTHLMLLAVDKSLRSKLTNESLQLLTEPISAMIRTFWDVLCLKISNGQIK